MPTLIVALAVLAPFVLTTAAPAAPSDQDLVNIACGLPHDYLVRTWNGYSPDRGPELTAIPAEPNFMGAGLPHVGALGLIQHVPMFWYGPGHIAANGEVPGTVTLADIAPTQSSLLQFDGFTAPDSTAMKKAIEPGQTPPKLVVVLVWDSAGINVLQEHAKEWPYLKSLIPKGTWYEDAYVGSSPTSTAQDHATIGTGSFPIHHGIVAHHFQMGGQDTTPWQIGPNFFVDPTSPTSTTTPTRTSRGRHRRHRRHPPRHARARLVLERRRPRHRDDALTRRQDHVDGGGRRLEPPEGGGRLLPPPRLPE